MISALAIAVWLYVLSAGFIALGWVLTLRLTPRHGRAGIVRWLYEWSAKGLALPLIIWGLMNVGLSWNLQPFMPAVQVAQNAGGPWIGQWLRATATGLLILSSYWMACTLAWVIYSTSRGLPEEPQKDFRALAFACATGLSIPALIVLLLGGWPMLGLALGVVLGPLAGYAPGIIQPNKLPPLYARAIARMKFGKYKEAEWEIIRELEKVEDDFEGWMMLAELYATRFNDLAEAQRTILEICEQPHLNASQLSVALHKLADWQLNLGANPAAARQSIQRIIDRLPGTHLARMAQLRLNQIPASTEKWRNLQTPKPIPLPALGDSLDESKEQPPELPDRKRAAARAEKLVEQLKADPDDVDAREKLARLFAEEIQRAELGLEQLRLLLNMPDQLDSKRAEWLGLSAAWHLKYQHDPATGRRILERIIQEFPTSPQAFAARRRLVALEKEARSESRA